MPEYCTCGAQLPPDARFCHKCGKPQSVEAAQSEAEREVAAVQATTTPPALPPEISFHNRVAVRSGMLAAFLGFLLIFLLPFPAIFPVILVLSFVAAGFFAVFLYRKLSGQFVSIRAGARMGWITGIFSFIIALVFLTVSVIYVSEQGGFVATLRKQWAGRDPKMDEVVRQLENPAYLAFCLIFLLVLVFAGSTLLPMIGGALGAKVLEKD